jgi:putative ABC transport system ATP-binding protein
VSERTALDHVALPFVARGLSRAGAKAGAGELLERFGLAGVAGRRFGDLSGGEAQRLMLARGVARRPDLLLIDEPTAQLDRSSARDVNRVVAALAREGLVVVLATHDPETRDMCGAVLDLGRSCP